MRQIAPGGNVVGKAGRNKHKQRLTGKESEYLVSPTYIYAYNYILYIYAAAALSDAWECSL